MKKKLFAVLFVLLLSIPSVFAKGNVNDEKKLGLGLNLGYPGVGLAFRYRNDNFRVLGAAAFDYDYKDTLAIDLTGEYSFAKLVLDDAEENVIDFGCGIGAGVGIPLKSEVDIYVAFEAGIIANYSFPSTPISIFVRGLYRPYLILSDDVEFEADKFAGSLGFTYNF